MNFMIIITHLGKTYGPDIVSYITEIVLKDKSKRDELIKYFEEEYPPKEIIEKIANTTIENIEKLSKKGELKYSQKFEEYTELDVKFNDSIDMKFKLIKLELTENINRYNNKSGEINELISVFEQWEDRYSDLIGFEQDSKKKINEIMNHLLTSDSMTAKDIIMYVQPILGIGSIGAIIMTMLAYMGVGTSIIAIVFGSSLMPVVGWGVGAATLAYLATLKINDNVKVQGVIASIIEILSQEEMIKLENIMETDVSPDFIIVIQLLKELILIDNHENNLEKQAMLMSLSKEYNVSKDFVEIKYYELPRLENIEMSLEFLKNLIDESQKVKIISMLEKVMISDGHIRTEEKQFIEDVKNKLIG